MVDGAWLFCQVVVGKLKIIPVLPDHFGAILRGLEKRKDVRLVYRRPPLWFLQIDLPVHLGGLYFPVRRRGLVLDVLRPVPAPLGRKLRVDFIGHAVEHVAVPERMRQDLVDKLLLVGQHETVVVQLGHSEEEILRHFANVAVKLLQSGIE